MIIPRQKLISKFFAEPEDRFPGCSETGIKDLIKIFSMGYNKPENIPHWLDVVAQSIIDTNENISGKSTSCFLLGFGTMKEIRKAKVGILTSKYSSFPKSPKEYFDRLWKETREQKKAGGVLGYQGNGGMPASPDDNVFLNLYQFGAYLNGTISLHDTDDLWEIQPGYPPLIFSQSIFDGFKEKDKSKVKLMLKQILENIMGIQIKINSK